MNARQQFKNTAWDVSGSPVHHGKSPCEPSYSRSHFDNVLKSTDQPGRRHLSYWVQCHCNLWDSHRPAASETILNSLSSILNKEIAVFLLSHYTIVWRMSNYCKNKSNLRYSGSIHFGDPPGLWDSAREKTTQINFHRIWNIHYQLVQYKCSWRVFERFWKLNPILVTKISKCGFNFF